MKGTKARPPQCAGLMQRCKFILDFFVFGQSGKILFYTSVVNTEKLVCSCSHVDIIRLALCPFLVHERIDWVINRRTLDSVSYTHLKGLSDCAYPGYLFSGLRRGTHLLS